MCWKYEYPKHTDVAFKIIIMAGELSVEVSYALVKILSKRKQSCCVIRNTFKEKVKRSWM